jgi:hypothetical protein
LIPEKGHARHDLHVLIVYRGGFVSLAVRVMRQQPWGTRHYLRAGMSEHVAQTAPMLIVAGLVAGWLSEVVAPRRRDGLLRDMALGIGGLGQPE